MSKTQKNKATSYHLGQLRAKLAKLKRELIAPSSGGGGGGAGFDVARTGIATVGFVGFPSVGKSTLMSGMTGQDSLAAAYEFTTLTTVPGSLTYRGAPIQILDLPGIIEGAKDGKGRGRQVIAVARTCNLIFIVLDVCKPLKDKALLEHELEGVGIRLNKRPPNIYIQKKDKGGIAVTNTVPLTKIDHDEIRAICSEYRISNASIAFRSDASSEDFIDVLEGNRIYIPAIYVLNKIDQISIQELDLLYKIPMSVPISSRMWLNVDELMEKMWTELRLVRIYTKPRKQQPDYSQPVVLREGRATVADLASAIHRDLKNNIKGAKVWGMSAKFPGQICSPEHVLSDEDVVSLIKR
ncbi:P-loop containing nucleoside triphosphate hydrolase protein [Jaminaea rosea]|uniref:P-loop containing nucleoside triphosphate hydrolase protein n=1 Tax=Jaminaea rosea TaxID=1569628 RepID=A0A316UL00_9BASI|nr:P-loop containing nucleoside triphosphate hydrolase protein [Jaminaea rosea]PWN25051.1 P-loop containing nucleoside triphosphate hydrolase protein [Jaminaea rosea]